MLDKASGQDQTLDREMIPLDNGPCHLRTERFRKKPSLRNLVPGQGFFDGRSMFLQGPLESAGICHFNKTNTSDDRSSKVAYKTPIAMQTRKVNERRQFLR